MYKLAGLLLASLLFATPVDAQQQDKAPKADTETKADKKQKPTKEKASKEKPTREPELQLLINRKTVWDGRAPVPPDVGFLFRIKPPTEGLLPGTRFRMASASFFYADPANQYGLTELGKSQSTQPDEGLFYVLPTAAIQNMLQGVYDKKLKRAQVVFNVGKIIRILPDGSEQEEEVKDKKRTLIVNLQSDFDE